MKIPESSQRLQLLTSVLCLTLLFNVFSFEKRYERQDKGHIYPNRKNEVRFH